MNNSCIVNLEQLQQRCAGHLDMAQSLIDSFFDMVDKDIADFDRALARGDVLRIASMAHRIQRCANKVGAVQTASAAKNIEASCRSGNLVTLPYEIECFRSAHKEARVAWSEQPAVELHDTASCY